MIFIDLTLTFLTKTSNMTGLEISNDKYIYSGFKNTHTDFIFKKPNIYSGFGFLQAELFEIG